MLASNQFSEIIRARSQLIGRLRTFLDTRGFVEVETPILAPNYGGANARPFITEHISDLPLYLRIAPELYLKQLVVGGLDRVYEIGKVFRNEGFDSTHNPEFTSCEFYQAYSNAEEMMRQVEDLMAELMSPNKALLDDFKSPFKRIEIVPFLEQRLGFEMPLSESSNDFYPSAILIRENVLYR